MSSSKGEIALSLTILSFVFMVLGSLIGSSSIVNNNVQKLFSQASDDACFYEAIEQVVSGSKVLNNVTGFRYRSKQYPSGTDFAQKDGFFPENPRNPGDLEVHWRTESLPTNYQDKFAQSELFIPEGYEIVNSFCENNNANPSNDPCSQMRDLNLSTIKNIPLRCGTSFTYGWNVRLINTPTPTSIPIQPSVTSNPQTGSGDMEVKVVALNYPQKTRFWDANHIASRKPASCTREEVGSQERPLYLSPFTIVATCVGGGCGDVRFESNAQKNQGHVSFHNIPSGDYALSIKNIDDKGFNLWSGCADKTWSVASINKVSDNNHVKAYVVLENEINGLYETVSNENMCTGGRRDETGQRGRSNIIEGQRGSYCYYGKVKTGPGGCGPSDILKCSGENRSRAGDGNGICRDAGLGSYVGWCNVANTDACCRVDVPSPTPTSVPRPSVTGGILPTQAPVVTACAPQANNLQQTTDTTTDSNLGILNDPICQVCCRTDADCTLGGGNIKGKCIDDAKSFCGNHKSCDYLADFSCRITKQTKAGQCNAACCTTNADCSNGEACIISNGNCKGENSCCRQGKVTVDNKCDAACCDGNDDCPNGQKCTVSNGGCKSGLSCNPEITRRNNIEVFIINRSSIKNAEIVGKCIAGNCMKTTTSFSKPVTFNPNMRSAQGKFNVDDGTYEIKVDNLAGLAQKSIFQIVKSAFAAPPTQIIPDCGSNGITRGEICEVTPNGDITISLSLCENEGCSEVVTPTPEPPITPPATPPSGDNRTLGSGVCSPSELIKKFDGDNRISQEEKEKRARDASCICQAESGSFIQNSSHANCLGDGRDGFRDVYALGLFQVENWKNSSVRDRCDDINGKEIGNGLELKPGTNNLCQRKPGHEGAWDACKQKWHTPSINIDNAFTLSAGFSRWCNNRTNNGKGSCNPFSTADACGLGSPR